MTSRQLEDDLKTSSGINDLYISTSFVLKNHVNYCYSHALFCNDILITYPGIQGPAHEKLKSASFYVKIVRFNFVFIAIILDNIGSTLV